MRRRKHRWYCRGGPRNLGNWADWEAPCGACGKLVDTAREAWRRGRIHEARCKFGGPVQVSKEP